MILWWIRLLNDFEVSGMWKSNHNTIRRPELLSGNSLERIQQYMVIEQEPMPTKEGLPPAYWPASGDLRVEKLSARYSEVMSL